VVGTSNIAVVVVAYAALCIVCRGSKHRNAIVMLNIWLTFTGLICFGKGHQKHGITCMKIFFIDSGTRSLDRLAITVLLEEHTSQVNDVTRNTCAHTRHAAHRPILSYFVLPLFRTNQQGCVHLQMTKLTWSMHMYNLALHLIRFTHWPVPHLTRFHPYLT